ncbi:TIGR01440 family protein [Butyrivibrio sp. MC2013]|uniref:TIGR01440 family protein n=1 Tax=Butyrivibrio sp. MC2013 TaxID=1280686 RepID=UPI000428E330|nr:TIGR01440 family protein [Butyrivibrio sp. MC2013]
MQLEDIYRETGLDLDLIRKEASEVCKEVIKNSNLKEGDVFVVGCSTSVVCGDKIGTNSSMPASKAVFEGIYDVLRSNGIYLAAQCCEHLNRSIVIEKTAPHTGDEVCVVPQPKAGGSFATCAYYSFKEPILVDEIKADAGMDIGGTMIGMHLKKVAVPIKLSKNSIGHATVIAAYTRPKYIGGTRASYEEDPSIRAMF